MKKPRQQADWQREGLMHIEDLARTAQRKVQSMSDPVEMVLFIDGVLQQIQFVATHGQKKWTNASSDAEQGSSV